MHRRKPAGNALDLLILRLSRCLSLKTSLDRSEKDIVLKIKPLKTFLAYRTRLTKCGKIHNCLESFEKIYFVRWKKEPE